MAGFKVIGRGQGQMSGSSLRSKSNIWCALVNIRGPALPNAAKSNKGYYQSDTLCTSPHMWRADGDSLMCYIVRMSRLIA